MKTVFENEIIKVSQTESDYDFIAVVENKTDKEVKIMFNNDELEYYNFSVGANDWVGLLANHDGYVSLEGLVAKQFTVV